MSGTSQRLFVTGGRGRLASLIADHFRAPAYRVSLFSRGEGPDLGPLSALLDANVFGDADVIFHLAWSSLPATSEKDPGVEQRHDLPYLQRLLAALAAAPQRPHVVFFSSGGAVYGNAPGRPSMENDACQPIGRYGKAKLAAEKMIEAAAERTALPYTILRISNPYGYPVPKSRVQGLIPHALRCAVDGQPLCVWGNGAARKDFLYYTDFLSALELVIERRLTGIYNLAAGASHQVSEVIAAVEAETERRIVLQHTPGPAWDVQDSRLDNSRFVEATGWRPQVSLTEGIRRAAAGYASH